MRHRKNVSLDPKVHRDLHIAAAKACKRPGHLADEAIRFFLRESLAATVRPVRDDEVAK